MERKFKSVEEVIRNIWESTNIPLQGQKNEVLINIEEPVHFIHPQLLELNMAADKPFIIISAPGAVGKTTFAKYSSYLKKGYYWDLSKIKIGNNSFIGTLADSFGPTNLPRVISELSSGTLSLFIDAFDEAEIISGWDGVETFLREIFTFCRNSQKPNIILFARAETAELLGLVLKDLSEEDIFSMYEIEYFDYLNAVHFVKSYLKREWGVITYETHPKPFKKALDSVFDAIAKGIDQFETNIWSNSDVRSFIGYAPVLETIASYMKDEKNFEELVERFVEVNEDSGGVKIIATFIEKLLEREQVKFNNGLKERIGDKANEWDGWQTIFNPDKQVRYLLSYVANNRDVHTLGSDSDVQDWFKKEYLESLELFLPNHPFLKHGNYGSPAFRDYTLGKLILNERNTDLCLSLLRSGRFVLTQLFALFYRKFSDNKCYGPHVGYLYESVSSRLISNENVILTYLTKKNDVAEQDYLFEIFSSTSGGYNDLQMQCIIDNTKPLVIERRLSNATINISSKVILGKSGAGLELTDVSVFASIIELRCKELVARSVDSSVVLKSDSCIQDDYGLIIKIIGGDQILKVDFDIAKSYPWVKYHQKINPPSENNLQDELFALKRILEPFRKHGKDEFGKQFEYIDNRIVSGSIVRKKLLDYLIHLNIITKEPTRRQYLMNWELLAREGVNWANLKSMIASPSIQEFILKFRRESNWKN